ncbi:hypothetical protein V4C87_19905, partial [Acinetobacter baumannii]|uniref:hypothetical protein n=1 Tax=Acinetobacter baumannii TaxID=470 RepID=UPI0036DADD03
FTGERRSDTKHTSPPAATCATNKVMLFLLRVVVQIISAGVMKLENSLAILFLSLRSIFLMPAQF